MRLLVHFDSLKTENESVIVNILVKYMYAIEILIDNMVQR